jgi:hypothetical protein
MEVSMTLVAEKEYQLIGKSKGCEDHDYDLVHELSKRLDALWRYDQYIANADKHPELQKFWREVKQQDQANVKKLKELLAREISSGCF